MPLTLMSMLPTYIIGFRFHHRHPFVDSQRCVSNRDPFFLPKKEIDFRSHITCWEHWDNIMHELSSGSLSISEDDQQQSLQQLNKKCNYCFISKALITIIAPGAWLHYSHFYYNLSIRKPCKQILHIKHLNVQVYGICMVQLYAIVVCVHCKSRLLKSMYNGVIYYCSPCIRLQQSTVVSVHCNSRLLKSVVQLYTIIFHVYCCRSLLYSMDTVITG